MTIEPVRCSVQVKAAPARAFAIFTAQTGLWLVRNQARDCWLRRGSSG